MEAGMGAGNPQRRGLALRWAEGPGNRGLSRQAIALTAPSATRVTQLLRKWRAGDSAAGARLIDVAYSELHRMARRQLRRELHDSLQATGLVNECYLRLI